MINVLRWVLMAFFIGLFLPPRFTIAQKKSSFSLTGPWLIELSMKGTGQLQSIIEFEQSDLTFEAHTRKHAAGDILGGWKALLARLFTDDFKHGSLIQITEGRIKQNGLNSHISGRFKSPIGDLYLDGTISNKQLTAMLLEDEANRRLYGTLTGIPINETKLPLKNYSEVINEILEAAEANIYDRSLIQHEGWKSYQRSMTTLAPDLKDDIELIFASYYLGRNLPFSHFALVGAPATYTDSSKPTIRSDNLNLQELNRDTALLTISSFMGSAEQVDSLFSVIKAKQYANLIVDLRNNRGGNIEAGMAFIRQVINQKISGGIFLTRKWYDQYDKPPKPNEYGQFPSFLRSDNEAMSQYIHDEAGLLVEAKPVANPYKGALYLLINGNTESTCEPIVDALKANNIATIVGTNTAGNMLLSEYVEMDNGFRIRLPIADYYTKQGYRIEGNGVKPDFQTQELDALNYVLDHLMEY